MTVENNLGRTGGPYLDIEDAKAREIKSAKIEGREPDFSQESLFPVVGVTNTADVPSVEDEDTTPPGSQVDAEASETFDLAPGPVETESETNVNEEDEDIAFDFESSK